MARSSWHTLRGASRLAFEERGPNMLEMRAFPLVIVAGLAIFGCGRPDPAPAAEPRGSTAAGHELVGKRLPQLRFDTWLGEAPGSAPTLYRWWTDSCAYCERSLPAIEALRRRFEPRGLRVVAVYHPKPPRDVAPEVIRGAAERLGYEGVIAVDRDWSELSRFYLTTRPRPATSASFLVDAAGIIRFVHPGPELTATDQAYRDLEHAIQHVLGTGGATRG